jgi:hypothetical protein
MRTGWCEVPYGTKYFGGGESIPLAVLYYTMVKYVLRTEQSVNDD